MKPPLARQRNLARLALVLASLIPAAAVYAVEQYRPSASLASSDPKQKTAKTELFNLKMKCAEIGMQYADALKRAGEHTGQSAAQPRFAYNAELNTCIIRAGYLDVRSGTLYKFIADSLTEETLFELSDNNPANQAKFTGAETRLMGPGESDGLAINPGQ
jgi:hypothetical protein